MFGIVLPLPLMSRWDAKPEERQPSWLPSGFAKKLVLHNPEPEYPVLAKMNYIQGAVQLEFVIDESGNVSKIRVQKGHPFLAIPAIKAVQQWRYKPFELGGRTKEARTSALVKFRLRRIFPRGRRNFKNTYPTPSRAEKDLISRVTPPFLVSPRYPGVNKTSDIVKNTRLIRVRVLLDKTGKIVDGRIVGTAIRNQSAILERIAHWKFSPAKFGTLPVPWYLEIDVPLEAKEQISFGAFEE